MKAICTVSIFACSVAGPTALAADYPLSALARQLKVALLKVEQSAAIKSLPPMESATLTAQTAVVREADGKISLYVVTLGSGMKSQATTTAVLTVKPPPATSGSEVSEVEIAEALADTIVSAREAIEIAKEGPPPLEVDRLVVNVKFALTDDGSGELRVAFPPFSVELSGAVSSSEVHEIEVRYADK